MFCGKGGVGKTSSTVALALYLSSQRNKKVAVVDYDGGHSVANTLGLSSKLVPNVINKTDHNLSIVVVENTSFVPIKEAKRRGFTIDQYLQQFPGSLGILPLSDMVCEFFGVLTDVITMQKFAILVDVLAQLEKEKYTHVIIDVEPTAGLERLLTNAESTVHSLLNLQNKGRAELALIGVKWPEIRAYLKGEYIRHADQHCVQIQRTVKRLKASKYFIVCTPEASPVDQTFEVRRIIEKFGGRVTGYVVNNMRNEPHESDVLSRLSGVGVPLVLMQRRNELHRPGANKTEILLQMGEILVREGM